MILRPYDCHYSFKIGQIFEVFKTKNQFWVKTYFELPISLQMNISSIWYIIYHHWKSLLMEMLKKCPRFINFSCHFKKSLLKTMLVSNEFLKKSVMNAFKSCLNYSAVMGYNLFWCKPHFGFFIEFYGSPTP